jgi:hypothetical protein
LKTGYRRSASLVGMAISGGVDWDEIAELIAESYRIQAPLRLADRVLLHPG